MSLKLRVLSFSGTHEEIGEAFGEACRDQIKEFYELRVTNALTQAKAYGDRDVNETTLLNVAKASMGPTETYDPAGTAELRGMARGADMKPEQILAMNGLTDFRDVLAWHGELETFGGCTSLIAAGDTNGDGQLRVAQTWDLATDNMPFVLGLHRKPKGAPETWCLTTVGCLSLIGINEHGIAVGTTNLRTTDARPGVTYLSMIHKALAQKNFDDAAAAIEKAERAGAHYFYVAGPNGKAAAMECTAQNGVARTDISSGRYVHCNHMLDKDLAKLEGNTPTASTHARQKRTEALLAEKDGKLDAISLQGLLADHENGENAICRHDYNGISTNGAVVMTPANGSISACHGLPHEATWYDLKRV